MRDKPRKSLAFLAAIAGLLGLATCGPPSREAEERARLGMTRSPIVARVNGEPVYEKEVLFEAVEQGAIREGEDLPPGSPLFRQALEDVISIKLFAMEAEERGLQHAAETQLLLSVARERILARALDDDILAKAATPGAIERAHRENIKLLREGNLIRGRRIVVASEESAVAVRRRVESGELFEKLAFDLSLDRRTAEEGGDFGEIAPDNLADSLRNALEAAKVGDIVGPIQTDQGWEVYKIEGKRSAGLPSLEANRAKYVEYLARGARLSMAAQLLNSARLEYFLDSDPNAPPEPDVPAEAHGEEPAADPRQAPPEQIARPLERET